MAARDNLVFCYWTRNLFQISFSKGVCHASATSPEHRGQHGDRIWHSCLAHRRDGAWQASWLNNFRSFFLNLFCLKQLSQRSFCICSQATNFKSLRWHRLLHENMTFKTMFFVRLQLQYVSKKYSRTLAITITACDAATLEMPLKQKTIPLQHEGGS